MSTLLDLEDIGNGCKCSQNNRKCSPKRDIQIKSSRNHYHLKDVIQNGLCMGCGLCVSIANDNDTTSEANKLKEKKKFLAMKVVPPGRYRPVFLQHEKD